MEIKSMQHKLNKFLAKLAHKSKMKAKRRLHDKMAEASRKRNRQ